MNSAFGFHCGHREGGFEVGQRAPGEKCTLDGQIHVALRRP